jgi:hypothetical protein
MDSDGWRVQALGATHAPAQTPRPSLVLRAEGEALLYAGGVHAFAGRAGVGKGWLAAWAAAQVLRTGGQVVWVDG